MTDEQWQAQLAAVTARVTELDENQTKLLESQTTLLQMLKLQTETIQVLDRTLQPIHTDWVAFRTQTDSLLAQVRAFNAHLKKLDAGEDWKGT